MTFNSIGLRRFFMYLISQSENSNKSEAVKTSDKKWNTLQLVHNVPKVFKIYV